jgi:hypothetical protein
MLANREREKMELWLFSKWIQKGTPRSQKNPLLADFLFWVFVAVNFHYFISGK